jgi:hypothetical protein
MILSKNLKTLQPRRADRGIIPVKKMAILDSLANPASSDGEYARYPVQQI